MTTPSSRPDTTAQQHAAIVREGLSAYWEAPSEYHSALDALLALLAQAQQKRDEARDEAGFILTAMGEPCAECGHVDWRADDERIDSYRNALERYRAVLKSDGHGSPSFHMSTCPGCAALRDEGGHS